MLRVRLCAAHMGGFLGPNFPKQGSFLADFPQTWVGLREVCNKLLKLDIFLPYKYRSRHQYQLLFNHETKFVI